MAYVYVNIVPVYTPYDVHIVHLIVDCSLFFFQCDRIKPDVDPFPFKAIKIIELLDYGFMRRDFSIFIDIFV